MKKKYIVLRTRGDRKEGMRQRKSEIILALMVVPLAVIVCSLRSVEQSLLLMRIFGLNK
jgi:hypothetical protein